MDILKVRFFKAVLSGKLGVNDSNGITVTRKEFINYFSDITLSYVTIFLPASTIDKGRITASQTKFLIRVKPGVYRLHPEAINIYSNSL